MHQQKKYTRSSASFGIAMQHADDGYSRCGSYGGSLAHNVF